MRRLVVLVFVVAAGATLVACTRFVDLTPGDLDAGFPDASSLGDASIADDSGDAGSIGDAGIADAPAD